MARGCYDVRMKNSAGTIRIGIGGWTYEPWRGTFYPDKWPQRRELEYASARLTAIEVNGTYYSGFKPATFASWREQTPDDFVFALKASRYCTNRKVLAEGGESIQRFVGQGIVELGDKLGPILWQFMATKKFDADDFGAFLKLLPARAGRGRAAPRGAGAARELRGARIRRAMPRGGGGHRLCTVGRLSRHRGCQRRYRLRPARDRGRGRTAGLFLLGTGPLGRRRRNRGCGATGPMGCPMSAILPPRPIAMYTYSSSRGRRSATPPPRRH